MLLPCAAVPMSGSDEETNDPLIAATLITATDAARRSDPLTMTKDSALEPASVATHGRRAQVRSAYNDKGFRPRAGLGRDGHLVGGAGRREGGRVTPRRKKQESG
jgi:hypothetical protein